MVIPGVQVHSFRPARLGMAERFSPKMDQTPPCERLPACRAPDFDPRKLVRRPFFQAESAGRHDTQTDDEVPLQVLGAESGEGNRHDDTYRPVRSPWCFAKWEVGGTDPQRSQVDRAWPTARASGRQAGGSAEGRTERVQPAVCVCRR